MENQDDAKQKKKEGRSPGYPAIDLETAIKRAGQIKEKEQRHLAPVEAIVEHWKYSSQSGPFLGTLSALIKFGLLETQGKGYDRKARITDLAWRILIDDREESLEKNQAIKEAALNPAIHKKLWDRYGGDFPSPETFRIVLLTEYKFMESAVKDFMAEFKRTITFAQLEKNDTLARHEEDKAIPEKETSMPSVEISGTTDAPAATYVGPPASAQSSGTRQATLWLSDTEWAKIEVSYPLSEAAWDLMKKMLDLYKRGLGVPDPPKPGNAN